MRRKNTNHSSPLDRALMALVEVSDRLAQAEGQNAPASVPTQEPTTENSVNEWTSKGPTWGDDSGTW